MYKRQAHNNLGIVLRRRKRSEEAIAQYHEALRINPAYAEAHYNLGNALIDQGNKQEAIAQYRQALQSNPGYAEAHLNLGNALFEEAEVGEAIAHAQKALELQPANVAIQNSLAWMLATAPQASLRNGAKALQLATRANQSTGGKNPLILRTLAAAYAQAGDFPHAIQTAHAALELVQSDSFLGGTLLRGIKLYEAGRPFEDGR